MTPRSHPLVFLVVVLAWTWALTWTAILARNGWLPFSPSTPLIALGSMGFVPLAIIFALREGGWATVGGALRRTFIFPRNISAWLLALVPAALILAGMSVGALLFWRGTWTFAPEFSPVLVQILVSAWLEEVVWRGYALPRLFERYGPAGASLRLGLMWMLWHMPYFWGEGYSEWGPWGYLGWAPFYFVYTFYFTWLYQRSRGSVLVATVSHFAVNWVILWFHPLAIENAGSLFAAAVLGLFMLRAFKGQMPAVRSPGGSVAARGGAVDLG